MPCLVMMAARAGADPSQYKAPLQKATPHMRCMDRPPLACTNVLFAGESDWTGSPP